MLLHDFDLKTPDLQTLSNRDAVVAFFAQLGYNTEARLPMTPAALGFPDTLAHEVTHAERVADHEEGELQVYLLEMKRVTVALTQGLARALRNRAGNFLLVLTADYERIDFVLMDLVRPEAEVVGLGMRQAYLRPRVLTIDRRNPTTVDLRVLRRFSYTEVDPYYQWDKLRSAYGVAEWSEPFFNNRALFSDYYLNERLPTLPEWQEDPSPAFRALTKLMADARQKFARIPEGQLRTELYEPLFKALGWSFQAQKGGADDDPRPDYVLTAPGGARVPCLTYVWDRYLDGPDETRDADTPRENPAQKVVGLLEQGEAGWAIVTSGKVWRLYSARAHSRATNYYEIDLEETLASPDVDQAFRYFWLFFRPSPPRLRQPLPDREKGGLLDFLLDESASYAKALGERLKDRVFWEIFPYFAEGFIRHSRRAADEWSQADLSLVFQATLTFLYRLLFLLYAEARDLLPARDVRGYWDVSLSQLKREIADKAGNIEDEVERRLEKTYSASETTLYDRLLRLFRVIDRGDAALNVPLYNGGLFVTFDSRQSEPRNGDESPEVRNARFLHEHKIPDRFLALGLDRLARDFDDKGFKLVPIDYKSLGVRQLGSIYEGLLEFQVRVAPAKMAVVQGKKVEEIVPYAEAKKQGLKIKTEGRGASKAEVTLPKGTVYLENDRHERKATGSYYTPDYIVKYIVQHTVGPVLDEKFEALRPRLRQTAKKFHDAVQRKQTIEKVKHLDRPALLNDLARDLLRDLFDVKVLDPAMGSGHFLVEVVDFITDRLLRFLNGFPFVAYFFEGQRRTILAEMERQGVTIDPARLTDVNLLKRHVLKRCAFGVDLNPMAVELAKVSLWLDCFTLGAPLSFLDHHLKWGNSLIGARIEEVREAVEFKMGEQISMFASSQFTGIMLATDLMRHVGELPDTTAEQVAASRAEFRKASDALAPYKRIMDVYVSKWFGNAPTKAQSKLGLEQTIEFLRRAETKTWLDDPKKALKALDPAMKSVAETALNAAQAKRFYHWELEFPEVFFGPAAGTTQAIGLKEDGGFDAVIGNPPYVDLKGMDPILVDYYFSAYATAENRLNIFAFFIDRAVQLAHHGSGTVGFIIPTVMLVQESYQRVRETILRGTSITSIVRLPSELFGEAAGQVKVDTMVLCLRKAVNPENLAEILIHTGFDRINGISPRTASSYVKVHQSSWLDNQAKVIGLTAGSSESEVLRKLEATSVELQALCEFCLGLTPYDKYAGHTREQIESRAFHSTEPRGKTWKRLLASGDVDRYIVEWGGEEWINYGDWLAAPREPRFFQKKRILVNQIVDWTTRRIKAGLTGEELYNTQNAFNLLQRGDVSLGFILALIDSTLMNFVHEKMFLDESKMRFQKVLIKDARRFPIRRISFISPAKRRSELAERGRKLYARCLAEKSHQCVLEFVNHHLSQQPEESDVVHDLLAFLAEQMIDLNKRKQAEAKRFLGWLEGALKISPDNKGNTGLDVLTGKTTLRNYLGDYQKGEDHAPFEAIFDVLHKNRTRLGISLSDAKFTARLKSEYEKSLAALLPIKEQLARTDGLIDQIVYRLYGLTEEEIAVVEG
jgi:hypothetical protein